MPWNILFWNFFGCDPWILQSFHAALQLSVDWYGLQTAVIFFSITRTVSQLLVCIWRHQYHGYASKEQYAIPKINMLHNLSCCETRFKLRCRWYLFKAFHSPSKQSSFEITIVLIVIVNGTAKEPLRCVVISFSFDFICWHSISMSSEPVELSRVRFSAKQTREVSVWRKQSKQARSTGDFVWLVIKIVIGPKERVLLQWSLTLDVILIVLITKRTPWLHSNLNLIFRQHKLHNIFIFRMAYWSQIFVRFSEQDALVLYQILNHLDNGPYSSFSICCLRTRFWGKLAAFWY